MDTSIFQRIYANSLLKGKDYEEFCKAHTEGELVQGTLLLKAGKIAREFYLIENGVFRSSYTIMPAMKSQLNFIIKMIYS